VVRLARERAGEHDEIARRQQRVQARGLGLGRQTLEPALRAEHAHAEAVARDAREP
jgi:hypothetical protein